MTNVRPITTGPRHHWFGYYDKLQFDPSSRYVLAMEVDFEHRSPTAEDLIRVGMIDLADGDRWIELGQTRAWCWQQGCMLQWIPGSDREVIWNDREGGRFVSHLLDVKSGKKRTIGYPIYTLSPDGRTAIGADFRRINHMRPGYGYAGIPDPNYNTLAPDDAGIYGVDLVTGEANLPDLNRAGGGHPPIPTRISAGPGITSTICSSTQTAAVLSSCTAGVPGGPGFGTRMMTAAAGGSEIYGVDQYGYTSPLHLARPATHFGVGQASLTPGRFLFSSGTGRRTLR